MLNENKNIVRRSYDEIWSKGNLAVVNELYATDFALYDPLTPGVRGPEGYQQYVMGMRIPFPDLQFTVEEQFAEGDKVATRWTARGTHQKEFMGIPATGEQGALTGITISRLVDGKIVEERSQWDALGFLQQLGVMPTPA